MSRGARLPVQWPRRHSTHRGSGRHVMDHHGVRPDDDVIADVHAPQYFCPGADLHSSADPRRAERIVVTGVAEGHPVPDQTIIADDRGAVYDDAPMVLDREPPADGRGRPDADPTDDFGQFVENHVDDGPGGPQDLVLDRESGVAEAVNQKRPESEAEQALPLAFEVFENDVHA